jgi:hypothetical protein
MFAEDEISFDMEHFSNELDNLKKGEVNTSTDNTTASNTASVQAGVSSWQLDTVSVVFADCENCLN